ncbi:MAG: CBS domain-containing protein [Pyrobaculum sp.]
MLKKEEIEKAIGKPVPQFVRDVLEHPPFRVTVTTNLETLTAYLRKFPVDIVPVFKSIFSDDVAGVVYPQTSLLLKSKKKDVNLGELINQPLVVKESWKIENVVEILMSESKWGAVVVDEEGKYVGVVSLRGLLSALALREPKAKSVNAVYSQAEEKKSRIGFVKAIERVDKVFKKIAGGVYDGYVVLNREGGAAGVLTVWDFVKSRRWYKGSGEPRPIFGKGAARGESKQVGVARVWRVMFKGVAVATPDTPLEEVARYMADSGLYVVPVVDRSGKVIGSVSVWDVFYGYLYGVKEGREDIAVRKAVEVQVTKPSLEAAIRLRPVKHVTGLRASNIMLRDIPAVNVRDTMSRVRKVFLRSGSEIVAVVDDEEKIVGFITRRDFLTYIAEKSLGFWKRQRGKWLVLKEHVLPGERAKIAIEEGTAGDIMKTSYPTAREDSTVEEIAYKMLAAGTDYIVIVDEKGAAVGVVTKRELAKAYAERGRSVTVGELMTPLEVAVVNVYSSLSSVVRKINAYELDGVLVTEGNELKGVVSVEDLTLRPIEETLRGEKIVFFTKSGELKKKTTGLSRMRYSKAGTLMAIDVMKTAQYVATVNSEVREVIENLIDQGVLPVVDEQGRLAGALNVMDIVKDLARVYVTYAAPEKIVEEVKERVK